jgi:hypothetical protein
MRCARGIRAQYRAGLRQRFSVDHRRGDGAGGRAGGREGVYTTHLRSEFEPILEALDEAFRIGRHGNVPVVVSHHKCAGAKNWGRTKETLAFSMRCASSQDIACDCYPYSASSSTLDMKQVTDEFDIVITWSEAQPERGKRCSRSPMSGR